MVKFVFVVIQGNALCYTEVKRTKYKILYTVFLKFLERKHAPNDCIDVVALCCERFFPLLYCCFQFFENNKTTLLLQWGDCPLEKVCSSDFGGPHLMVYINHLSVIKINLAGVICCIYHGQCASFYDLFIWEWGRE